MPSRALVSIESTRPPPGPSLVQARRPGMVSRTGLVNRLRAARSFPVASIVAPRGYGKTTLLAQWAARDDRPFAFVALDTRVTDAAALVARIAEAAPTLASDVPARGSDPPDTWAWGTAVPRLAGGALAAEPFVLVLDDAQLLTADAARVVTILVRSLPAGSTIVLSGREQPLSSIPRLRASGEVLELGRDDLALSSREARTVLRRAGVELSEERVQGLLKTLEGWPAGLQAAAVSLREHDATHACDLHEAYLAALTQRQREFLGRTSTLDVLSAPLCDAVLGRRDSAAVLASLETSLLLVPIGRDGHRFRHHRAFRELLRTELEEQEPGLVPTLERQAADWFEAHDDPESALRHALAAGDAGHVAVILDAAAVTMHNSGQDAALVAWIAGLDATTGLDDHPRLAALAARLHAQAGNAPEAARYLATADQGSRRRTRSRLVDPRVALVRAAMCEHGVEPMLAAVESALRRLPADDRWRPYGLLLQGTARALLGETERGDAILSRAVHAAERLGSTETRVLALTQRSLLATARGERPRADALLGQALAAMDDGSLQAYPTCALTLALSARSRLLCGHAVDAASALKTARRLAAGLTVALPWLAVQCRLELARVCVTVRDAAAARAILKDVDDLIAARPKLGVLREERDRIGDELRLAPIGGTGRATSLTGAELKLLPMLATHLSFREIGLRFFLSRNTVKTQAISVYRKLGASNRSEAVERAHTLGLIDPGLESASLILNG